MPIQQTVYKIILASPSDVQQERDLVDKVVDKIKAEQKDQVISCVLYRWETDVQPGFNIHGPQAIIDSVFKIEDSDLFIGIFYKKFGTPVGGSESGTEHELKQAIISWEKENPRYRVILSG